MRNTSRSAAALLTVLSFFLFSSTAATDLLTQKSKLQESKGGADASSNSDARIAEAFAFSLPKGQVRSLSSSQQVHRDVEDNSDASEKQQCSLASERLQQMKSTDGSEWLIDNKTLGILHNNPQELVQCTQPGDRVVFNLTGMHKFNQTLVVSHKLEFINKSPEMDDTYNDVRQAATFTCPDDGPFLNIKSGGLNVSGLLIQNCTNSSGEGAIVIQANSKVTIEKTIFRSNRRRAIFVASNATLTLITCHFEDNGHHKNDGGGVYAQNNVFLVINDSLFYNNTANNGGAIYGFNNDTLIILFSNFSRNIASKYGGGISLTDHNDIKITDTTLSKNNAEEAGGAVALLDHNNLTVINATMSGNNATHYGAAIGHQDHNNLTIINATLLENNAEEAGGAVALRDYNNLVVINSIFSGNTANKTGGALYMETSNTFSLTGSTISLNHALRYGGGVFAFSNNIGTILNSNFSRNEALTGGSIFLSQNTTLNILDSTLSNNFANQHGTVYASAGCSLSINGSIIVGNKVEYGGFLFGAQISLNVSHSNCSHNVANKSGGCFYLESTNAIFTESEISTNHAKEDGGGLYATVSSDVQFENCTMKSNRANKNGGVVAAVSNSRFICGSSIIENNVAVHGGGVYLEANSRQSDFSVMINSTFRSNTASRYGGALVIKTFGLREVNYSDIFEDYNRLFLVNSNLIDNEAMEIGAALMATCFNIILVSCTMIPTLVWSKTLSSQALRYLLRSHYLNDTRFTNKCPSWHGNHLSNNTKDNIIGSFGQKLSIKIDSKDGAYVKGNDKSGLVFYNVTSGKPLPRIEVSVLDVDGKVSAPLYEEDAIVLSSPDGFLAQPIAFSFENGTCVIEGIVRFVHSGNYTMKFNPKSDDVLEALEMTIVVRECVNDEERALDGRVCQACGEAHYNFNSNKSDKCAPCPKGADCTGRYIIPIQEHWHKSPCHDKIKKCIVEDACNGQDRINKLNSVTRNLDNCTMTNSTLVEYEDAQCNEGYEGPLCGSCKESYGLSSSFECFKCGAIIMSVLKLMAVICYLLFKTFIAIKGVLPLKSTQHANEDVETPLLESNEPSLEATSSSQVMETIQHSNASHSSASQEERNVPNDSRQPINDVEVAKQMAVEAWKILLNFFQVTSTAATMDVDWTDEVLATLEKFQAVGAATINYVSRPIDCLLSSATRATRVIWRTLFSVCIPAIVILILATYWGYRAIMVHEGDALYFLKRLLLTMTTTIYITYFDLTQVVVRVFNCVVVYDNIDPFSKIFTRSWIADTTVECYKGSHIVLVGIALVILILVSIGFPLFCSLALYFKKDDVNTISSWAHDTLSFLCGPFKERFIYWECVTMIKKSLLSIIIVFSYSLGIQAQGLLILMILGFFLYLHLICYPYDERLSSLNYYEGGSLLVSCTVYTLVQFFNVPTFKFSRKVVSISLIVVSVGFVGVMLYKICQNLIKLLKGILESRNVRVLSTANWFSILRLYMMNRKRLNWST